MPGVWDVKCFDATKRAADFASPTCRDNPSFVGKRVWSNFSLIQSVKRETATQACTYRMCLRSVSSRRSCFTAVPWLLVPKGRRVTAYSVSRRRPRYVCSAHESSRGGVPAEVTHPLSQGISRSEERLRRIEAAEHIFVELTSVEDLEEKLRHRFSDRNLLVTSMLHKSAQRAGGGVVLRHPDGTTEEFVKHGAVVSNDRLEWLGDRVFDLSIASHFYKLYPEASEGDLTEMSKRFVSRGGMSKLGCKLGLEKHIVTSVTVPRRVGNAIPSRVGSFVESVFGALHIDGGPSAVDRYFQECCVPFLEQLAEDAEANYKGDLLELLLSHGFLHDDVTIRFDEAPKSVGITSGPAHRRTFWQSVYFHNRPVSHGSGSSKRRANQEAARVFLKKLEAAPDITKLLEELSA